MLERFGSCGFPGGGCELTYPGDRPLAQFGKDVPKIVAQTDVEPAAGFDNGGNSRHLWPGLTRAALSTSGGAKSKFLLSVLSPPPPVKLPSKRWRDLILRVWHVDPLRCPVCNSPMRVLASLTTRAWSKRYFRPTTPSDEPKESNIDKICPLTPSRLSDIMSSQWM
jgi:hypothetical protein